MLTKVIEEDRCDFSVASEFVGRFSWSCAVQADNVGRVYIRFIRVCKLVSYCHACVASVFVQHVLVYRCEGT